MEVSYCTLIYKGNELLQALEHVQSAGYEGIELYSKDWRWALNNYSVDEFRDTLNQFALKVTGVMGGVLGREKDLEIFREASDLAAAVGCPYVFFVAAARGSCPSGEFITLARKAARYAQEKGLQPLLHHHAGTLAETVNQTRGIVESVGTDTLSLCFDSVHFALFERDLTECVRALGDIVRYVHLKDIKKEPRLLVEHKPREGLMWGRLDYIAQEYTGLGEGTIDNEAVVHAFLDIGYKGWWVIEIEKQEYSRKEHAVKNLKTLESYFRTYPRPERRS